MNMINMETDLLLAPPTFKHAEIKSLLTERMKRLHPSFRFLMATTGVYHFQRMKDFHDYYLKEALHFVFSQSDLSMHVSISSRLNPVHTLTPAYNNGFINPHVDLGAIARGHGIFPSSRTAYRSNGTSEGLIPIIDHAIDDFGTEGLAYLDLRWNNLNTNALVETGIAIIDKWKFDKTMLRNELNVQLRKARLIVEKLRHPLYKEFKRQLAAIPGQSPHDYKEIPRLAFELMELYCNSRIIS